MKKIILITAILLFTALALGGWYFRPAWWALLIAGPLLGLVIYDLTQTRHTILRNYPVFGHFRYVLEDFRKQIRQYFIESDLESTPYPREQRAAVYQRAKGQIDSLPLGTIKDYYAVGHEWLHHSIRARNAAETEPRVLIGEKRSDAPYSASRFNISAMSFGSISGPAIQALNRGARTGGFYHNTGEGGISRHHLEHGGDLVWEIGTGYFGCRNEQGGFDEQLFSENARRESVRMIELKLSQGAKPGGGGLLPGGKVNQEISEARGVPVGQDVLSPPAFDQFDTPCGLLEFLQRLREASGRKPVGFKLCIGQPAEFMAVIKAMRKTGIRPDFITIDGAEGGTGAAPLEFVDYIGMPLRDGLIFAHNALVGSGLREDIRLIASGKVTNGFDIVAKLAMGADLCNAARGFMFALGCIQARVCNRNICPTGITTLDPWRTHGLVVEDKYKRVAAYHEQTVHHFLMVLGACGVESPEQLDPSMLNRRVAPTDIRNYRELYPWLEPGQLLEGAVPGRYAEAWAAASADRF